MSKINIQNCVKGQFVASDENLAQWLKLTTLESIGEVNVKIVKPAEMKSLNKTYRNINKITNVLAFPFTIPEIVGELILGDVILCAEQINLESNQQQKPKTSHWAHISIHGALHLIGFDHQTEAEALIMQNQEIAILSKFNIANPY